MKKLFVLMAAAFAMVACQTDINEVGVAGGEVDVTFEVGTPTRAYSDGTTATVLQYAVYEVVDKDNEGTAEILKPLTVTNGEIHGSTTVKLQLVTGNTYAVVFWAAAPNAPYTVDFGRTLGEATMTVVYDADKTFCNDEKRDAFYKKHVFTVKGAQTETIELRRPFAQLNIGTNDYDASANAGYVPVNSYVEVAVHNTLKLATGEVDGQATQKFNYAAINKDETFPVTGYQYLAMNYLLVDADKETVDVVFGYSEGDAAVAKTRVVGSVPVQRNYRTNIYGQLLTSDVDINVVIKPEYEDTAYDASLQYAAENGGVVKLSEDLVLENPIKVKAGKVMVIDLNGHTLSATSTQTGQNYNMLDVNNATLTVKNGTIEYEHKGENMGWSNSTNIFNVTNGGVLNLEGVTAKNLGGSDMGFVAHLNNWGEVTLNAENCVLESNYVPVRVFNSGPHMNNVTIKNSTLKGVSAAFWVHNYTVADFGTEAKAEAQKSLLNLNIYNQGNTFSPDVNGICYGFTNSIRSDAYGITKSVSEDGTVVTLGSVIENGLVRRGVAGAEENTTIKKVVVGEGITTLYDRTFRRYYALEEVILPSTLTTIGAAGSGVFQSCTNLKSVVLPESVTVLGKGSFQECSSLESINIPAGVTRIEEDVFRNTGLTSIEFHAGVTYFGAQAFRDCKQLTKVVINAPEFTMEGNTFGIMAAPFTPMTIEVANAEMKTYVESKLGSNEKTYITVVAPEVIDNTAALQAALAEGKNVNLANDLTISSSEMLTAPYGNKMALSHNGGVFNGNGKTIGATIGGDNYVVMTKGGTIKNLNINNGFRGVVIMSANQTVYLENVVSSGEGVCYALNTAEGDSTQDLVATNCTFNGWLSWSLLKSAKFTNCSFGQGAYYTNVYGRLGKPYVTTLFDGCEFGSKFYIDLSALGADQVVTLKNCTVNGVKLTAENWASIIAPESTCGEGQISVELKDGTYLTAENVADYFVIE